MNRKERAVERYGGRPYQPYYAGNCHLCGWKYGQKHTVVEYERGKVVHAGCAYPGAYDEEVAQVKHSRRLKAQLPRLSDACRSCGADDGLVLWYSVRLCKQCRALMAKKVAAAQARACAFQG